MTGKTLVAGAFVALAFAAPALAQGKSQQHKKGAPPSRNELASPPLAAAARGAVPFAWVDDATVLEPGGVSISISALRWDGADVSEVDVPVVDVALGVAERVQFSASVPRVAGAADPAGAAGGLGTTFFSTKVALVGDRQHLVKLAVAPTLAVLGEGVRASLGAGQSRVQWGLPVSAEIDPGPVRAYGAGGYFSSGIWFSGVGVAVQTTSDLIVSTGFSRAWRRAELPNVPLADRVRNELSGGAAYALSPHVSVFGSIGRTIATLDQNGAGTTIAGGFSVWFSSPSR